MGRMSEEGLERLLHSKARYIIADAISRLAASESGRLWNSTKVTLEKFVAWLDPRHHALEECFDELLQDFVQQATQEDSGAEGSSASEAPTTAAASVDPSQYPPVSSANALPMNSLRSARIGLEEAIANASRTLEEERQRRLNRSRGEAEASTSRLPDIPPPPAAGTRTRRDSEAPAEPEDEWRLSEVREQARRMALAEPGRVQGSHFVAEARSGVLRSDVFLYGTTSGLPRRRRSRRRGITADDELQSAASTHQHALAQTFDELTGMADDLSVMADQALQSFNDLVAADFVDGEPESASWGQGTRTRPAGAYPRTYRRFMSPRLPPSDDDSLTVAELTEAAHATAAADEARGQGGSQSDPPLAERSTLRRTQSIRRLSRVLPAPRSPAQDSDRPRWTSTPVPVELQDEPATERLPPPDGPFSPPEAESLESFSARRRQRERAAREAEAEADPPERPRREPRASAAVQAVGGREGSQELGSSLWAMFVNDSGLPPPSGPHR